MPTPLTPWSRLLPKSFSGLLKNAHRHRFPHPSSLQRTSKYASFLRIFGASHLGIFEQPGRNQFFILSASICRTANWKAEGHLSEKRMFWDSKVVEETTLCPFRHEFPELLDRTILAGFIDDTAKRSSIPPDFCQIIFLPHGLTGRLR